MRDGEVAPAKDAQQILNAAGHLNGEGPRLAQRLLNGVACAVSVFSQLFPDGDSAAARWPVYLDNISSSICPENGFHCFLGRFGRWPSSAPERMPLVVALGHEGFDTTDPRDPNDPQQLMLAKTSAAAEITPTDVE